MVDAQARMMGTNDIFWLSGILFIVLALLVWVARRARPFGADEKAHAPEM
jgi:DHA2 family multidrug resistance protein